MRVGRAPPAAASAAATRNGSRSAAGSLGALSFTSSPPDVSAFVVRSARSSSSSSSASSRRRRPSSTATSPSTSTSSPSSSPSPAASASFSCDCATVQFSDVKSSGSRRVSSAPALSASVGAIAVHVARSASVSSPLSLASRWFRSRSSRRCASSSTARSVSANVAKRPGSPGVFSNASTTAATNCSLRHSGNAPSNGFTPRRTSRLYASTRSFTSRLQRSSLQTRARETRSRRRRGRSVCATRRTNARKGKTEKRSGRTRADGTSDFVCCTVRRGETEKIAVKISSPRSRAGQSRARISRIDAKKPRDVRLSARPGIERADVHAKRREGRRRSLRVRASAAVDRRRGAFHDARRRDAPRSPSAKRTAPGKAALKVAKRKQQPSVRERVVSRRASGAPYLSRVVIFVGLRVRRIVRRRLRVAHARVLLDATLAASRRRLFGSAVVARVFVRDVRRVSRRGRHVHATARARRGTRARGLEVRRERPVALSRSSCVCVCCFAANAARESASLA